MGSRKTASAAVAKATDNSTQTDHCQPPFPAKPLLSSIFFCPPPFCDFCCAASCFRNSSGTLEMDDFINICLRSYLQIELAKSLISTDSANVEIHT